MNADPSTLTPALSTGAEWVIDAYDCDADRLTSLDFLQQLCTDVISDLGLCVVGEPQWHQFPFPGGVTGLYLLSESHLACHTYPEHQFATFNLYCCRERSDWNWAQELSQRLSCGQIDVRRFERGSQLKMSGGEA